MAISESAAPCAGARIRFPVTVSEVSIASPSASVRFSLAAPIEVSRVSTLPSSPSYDSPTVCSDRERDHTTLPHNVSGAPSQSEGARNSDQRMELVGGGVPIGVARRESAPKRWESQELAPPEGNVAYCHPESAYWPPFSPWFTLNPLVRPSSPSGARPEGPHPAFAIEEMPNPIPLPRHPAPPFSFVRNSVPLRTFAIGLPLSPLSHRCPKSSLGHAVLVRPSDSRPRKRGPSPLASN